MRSFLMNGIFWRVETVSPDSPYLVDRTGSHRLATTDPKTKCVYLSSDLEGEMLTKVLIHELGHCVMVSYDMFDYIHRMIIPEYWIEMEEWVCNFIADYGLRIFRTAQSIIGDRALNMIPAELERIVA